VLLSTCRWRVHHCGAHTEGETGDGRTLQVNWGSDEFAHDIFTPQKNRSCKVHLWL
jgi:hypothetical protein